MEIFLFDVSGQLLLSDNLEVGQLTAELEMKGIDAGAYWLELVSNNNSLVRQLIKL
ncbi:MAG: T9SS type A sorting domain-containing protein [Bacteroidetes bacterium]|nr:T9SS type A sorting domain-containing protein [Bacteroidota bacterium]